MEAFVIHKRVKLARSNRIRAFHYNLYHGVERRPIGDRGYVQYYLHDQLSERQSIVRSGTRVPDIFAPGLVWIVSEAVRECLRTTTNVDCFAVQFEKIFDMDFREGDFSWYDDPMRKQPPALFDDLPEAPELRWHLGSYYELIIARNHVVGQHFPSSKRLPVDLSDAYVGGGNMEIWGCAELLEEYPMTREDGTHFVRSDIFELLEEYLHPDYFLVKEVRV